MATYGCVYVCTVYTLRYTNWHNLQERVRGGEYDEVIDELIVALRERYGTRLILHWEDFNVRNSFRLLDKYVAQVCPLVQHASWIEFATLCSRHQTVAACDLGTSTSTFGCCLQLFALAYNGLPLFMISPC